LKIRFAAALFLLTGCLEQSESPPTFSCPSDAPDEWPVVSQVMERKCGTLDCHGARERPLRFYGRNGARLADSQEVGTDDATTSAELEENRSSVCGLEPEKMHAVVEDGEPIDTLTVVRKPLLIEAHKGGRVWQEDSPGFVCLKAWLEGSFDRDACEAELAIP
jgi:hypothetical protein